MKIGVRTFTLPGQEYKLEEILNDPLIEVTTNKEFPCPKEGIVLVYIVFKDHSEEGALN